VPLWFLASLSFKIPTFAPKFCTMAQKPSIPKGTRDFLPQDVARRTYIFDTIRSVFKSYGFVPIETPSFELSSTLLGKYGEEGDKLIFRVLNSGNYLKNFNDCLFSFVLGMTKFTQDWYKINEDPDWEEVQLSFSRQMHIYAEMANKILQSENISANKFSQEVFPFILERIGTDGDVKSKLQSFLTKDEEELKEFSREVIKDFYIQLKPEQLVSWLSEKALRYDLTVPFARFVVQHQNELTFPFKRYQIQQVWRADKPQNGRYREFYQCDADVVGSDSLLYEVDFVQIFDQVLTKLNIPAFTILINNRKILSGIAEVSGEADKLIDITVAIDKLDKVGEEGVVKELREKGVSETAIATISPLFTLKGTNEERLAVMRTFLATSEIGLKGIEELEFVLEQTKILGVERANVEFDVTLARGLNYYTGAIFEVKAHDSGIGSICGGGRYDDLTGVFGLKDVSGVGISFGADRIYLVMEKFDLFPKTADASLTLLFANFGEEDATYCMKLSKQLRAIGVDCDVYPSNAKMQKQFKYADNRNAQYVALIGENERNSGQLQLKNMTTGEQQALTETELMTFFQ
jgi:histidyl-tRNA synthetase